MPTRISLLLGFLAFVASATLVGDASAACVGSTCSLGGQLRTQIGFGPPRPLSLAPAPDGDLRWGQPGQIQATPSATVQQGPAGMGTPATDPRSLMFVRPGLFSYDGPLVSLPIVKNTNLLFQIQTDFEFAFPHPGTTGSGATAVNGPFSNQTLAAGGRTGPSVVSWCAGFPAPTASYNPGCATPNAFGATYTFYGRPAPNGLVRYTATRNQFGGPIRLRKAGMSRLFYNAGGLTVGALPCTYATNPLCLVAILDVNQIAHGVTATEDPIGGRFAARVFQPPVWASTAVFEANVGASGTINSVGAPLTDGMGNPIPLDGEVAESLGLPGTTGRLTISITELRDPATALQTFTRTGGDNRTTGGEGIVSLVSGAISARYYAGPTAGRGWATFNVPEPSAIMAASAAFLALFGCHLLVQRRRR